MSGDGTYSSSRGGYSYYRDSYSTWMNNPGGGSKVKSYLDHPIEFPTTHNEVTINVGGCGGYRGGSWWQPLVAGSIGLGIQGLFLGLLGRLGRKQAQQQNNNLGLQANNFGIQANNFWNNFFATWKTPTINKTTDPDKTKEPDKAKEVDKTTDPDKTKKPDKPEEVTAVKPGNVADTDFVATAINTNLTYTKPITGNVKNVIYGDLAATKGYPQSFEVHDTTLAQGAKYSDGTTPKANIYTFTFVSCEEGGDPQYRCTSAKLFNKSAKFNDNIYNVPARHFGKIADNDKYYEFKNDPNGMTTNGSSPTYGNISKNDAVNQEEPTTYS